MRMIDRKSSDKRVVRVVTPHASFGPSAILGMILLLSGHGVIQAQTPASGSAPAVVTVPVAAASPVAAPTEALRPVIGHISEAVAGLSVSRWKAPGSVRSVAQRDADSIQHDLSSTLPPLLESAKSAPTSVAAAFAVYRNIDALYDVLLRVSETATLAAAQSDADKLQSTLTALEASRRELGDAILQLADDHERELTSLRAAAAQAAAADIAAAEKPAVSNKTVVVDGPATPAKSPAAAKKKKKPTPTPAPGSTENPPATQTQ
jgi:hypothetical protein